MARSLGMAMDDPENAAKTVKAALTVRGNRRGEAGLIIGPGGVEAGGERGVLPLIRWRRQGEDLGKWVPCPTSQRMELGP